MTAFAKAMRHASGLLYDYDIGILHRMAELKEREEKRRFGLQSAMSRLSHLRTRFERFERQQKAT